MSRRNEMTDDGKIPCGLCHEWLFVGAFYTLPVIEGVTSFRDIWFGDPVTGKQYGRPKSYCKVCNGFTQKGGAKLEAYKAKLRGLVWDVDEAWLMALSESTDRSPDDPLTRMMRDVGMLN